MALENALIAKIVGGITAVGASGGAGVYAYQSGFLTKLFSEEKIEDYLVVAVDVITEVGKKPSKPLYETAPGNAKNFKCFIAEGEEDLGCDIFKITTSETTKISTFTDINKDGLEKTKDIADLKKGDLFKLKIDTSKLKTEIKYDSSSYLIDLKNITSVEESTKPSYGKLKVLAKISGNSVITDYKKIIVKATSNTIDAATTDYQCNIGGKEGDDNQLGCTIYSFSTDATEGSKINFSSKLTEITDAKPASVKANSFYVIDFSKETGKEKLKKLTLENLKETIIFQGTDKNKKAVFSMHKLFVGEFKETNNNIFAFDAVVKKP